MSDRFPDVDWYCDRCNAYLNDQDGFDDHKYTWVCAKCGHKNSISATNIYNSEEDFRDSTDW